MLTESEFNELIEHTFEALEEALDQIDTDLDYQLSGSVLTIEFDNETKLVFSRQPRTILEVARECAKFKEVIRSVKVETMPDGTVVKTIHVISSVFDAKNAIKAIHELNLMDGDYAAPRNRRFG